MFEQNHGPPPSESRSAGPTQGEMKPQRAGHGSGLGRGHVGPWSGLTLLAKVPERCLPPANKASPEKATGQSPSQWFAK